MENKKGGELICKRPESIIEARFNLTKRQNDILDMVFASIQDDHKLKYEIDISKYGQLYNIKDKSNIYRDLKKAVKTFEGKGFSITQKINEKKENRIYFSWFSSISYLDGESKIIIELGQTLKEIMLSAKKACFYQIKYPLNFHNIYSKRLYYYLKSYENSNKDGTGWRIDNIDELRSKLECPKSYDKFADFRKYVLTPAYNEISDNSDISFEYEKIKTKTKVTALRFYIHSNKAKAHDEVSATSEEPVEVPSESFDIESGAREVLKILQGHKLSTMAALAIYKNSNGDIEYIKKVYEYSKTQDVKNLIGYMKDMVKPGVLQENIKTSKVSTFSDFEQRTYEYNDLEKKLLGWENNENGDE